MDLAECSIDARHRKRLEESGFETAEQTLAALPWSIERETQLAPSVVRNIMHRLSADVLKHYNAQAAPVRTGSSVDVLSTGDARIDTLLGGGIRTGMVTEIAGFENTGKTQLCFQLGAMCQLDDESGGLNAGSIFVTSHRNIAVQRLADIHAALSRRSALAGREPTKRKALENVHIAYAPDAESLEHLTQYMIPNMISRASGLPVRLVVIDSLSEALQFESVQNAAPAKSAFERVLANEGRTLDTLERLTVLSSIMESLKRTARIHNVAIIVVNAMFNSPERAAAEAVITRNENEFFLDEASQKKYVFGASGSPYFGYRLANAVNACLVLSQSKKRFHDGKIGERTMGLVFSPFAPSGVCAFRITKDGISAGGDGI